MEQDIYKIYHNNFGISFKWINPQTEKVKGKVQLIFRDMGFYLTHSEIKQFYNCVCAAKNTEPCSCCQSNIDSKNIMLKTPSNKIDIAVNEKELSQVEDLIKGTLFQLDLEYYLETLCKN